MEIIIKMKKILLLILFTPLLGQAQSKEDFENFGETLYRFITDTSQTAVVQYIRDKEYHALIDRQPLSPNQKSEAKLHINATFGEKYRRYQESVMNLQDAYRQELLDGASFEYLNTHYEALNNSRDTYAVQTTFLYRNGRIQSRVRLNVDVAWLGDRMVVTSPVREDF